MAAVEMVYRTPSCAHSQSEAEQRKRQKLTLFPSMNHFSPKHRAIIRAVFRCGVGVPLPPEAARQGNEVQHANYLYQHEMRWLKFQGIVILPWVSHWGDKSPEECWRRRAYYYF